MSSTRLHSAAAVAAVVQALAVSGASHPHDGAVVPHELGAVVPQGELAHVCAKGILEEGVHAQKAFDDALGVEWSKGGCGLEQFRNIKSCELRSGWGGSSAGPDISKVPAPASQMLQNQRPRVLPGCSP